MEKNNKKKSKKTTKKAEPRFEVQVNLDQEEPTLPEKVEVFEEDALKLVQVSYVKPERQQIIEQVKEDLKPSTQVKERQQAITQKPIQNGVGTENVSKEATQQNHLQIKFQQQCSVTQKEQKILSQPIQQQSKIITQSPKQSAITLAPKTEINEQEQLNLLQSAVSLNKPKGKKQLSKTKSKKKPQAKVSKKNHLEDLQFEELQIAQVKPLLVQKNQETAHQQIKIAEQPTQKQNSHQPQSAKVQEQPKPHLLEKVQKQQQPISTPSKPLAEQIEIPCKIVQELKPSIVKDTSVTKEQQFEQSIMTFEQTSNLNKSSKKDTGKGKKKKAAKTVSSSIREEIKFDIEEEIVEAKPAIHTQASVNISHQQIISAKVQGPQITSQLQKQINSEQRQKPYEKEDKIEQIVGQDKIEAVQIKTEPRVQKDVAQEIVQIKQDIIEPVSKHIEEQEIELLSIDLKNVKKTNELKRPKKKNAATTTKKPKQSSSIFESQLTFSQQLEPKQQQKLQQIEVKQQNVAPLQQKQQIIESNLVVAQAEPIKVQQPRQVPIQHPQQTVHQERKEQLTSENSAQYIDTPYQFIVHNYPKQSTINIVQAPKTHIEQQVLQVNELIMEKKSEPKKKSKKQKKQKTMPKKKQISQSNFQLEMQIELTDSKPVIPERQIILNDADAQQPVRQKHEKEEEARRIEITYSSEQERLPKKQQKAQNLHSNQKQQIAETKNTLIEQQLNLPQTSLDQPITLVQTIEEPVYLLEDEAKQINLAKKKPVKKTKTTKKKQENAHKNNFDAFELQQISLQTKTEEASIKAQAALQGAEQHQQQEKQMESKLILQQRKEIESIPVQIMKQNSQEKKFPQQPIQIKEQREQKKSSNIEVKDKQIEDVRVDQEILIITNDSNLKADKNKKPTKKAKAKPKAEAKNANISTQGFLFVQQPSTITSQAQTDNKYKIKDNAEKQASIRQKQSQITLSTQLKGNKEEYIKNIEKPIKEIREQRQQKKEISVKKQIVSELINLIRFHNDEEIKIMRERMQMLQEDILSRMIRSKDIPKRKEKKTDYQWIVEQNIELRNQYQSLNGSSV